jgi:outer membrane autotransporter protein
MPKCRHLTHHSTAILKQAMIDDRQGDLVTSHVGAEISHDAGEKTTIRGRSAWGHRYTGSDAIVATAIGITQAIAPYDGGRDWAEVGVTVNYNITNRTTFTIDVAGRAGKTADPAANVTIGLVVRW